MNVANERVSQNAAGLANHTLVEHWLEQFNDALDAESEASIAALFAADGHWRDLLAFTWTITPCQGANEIAALMVRHQRGARVRDFAIARERTPPRRVTRAGTDVIEAIVQFESEVGRGFGVLRLLASAPAQAFQLMTSLHELKGFEEKIGKRRVTGEAYSRNFGGANWKDQRAAAQAYAGREPTVLIAGGGQAGLSFAATLGLIGVDCLVVDKLPRVGDCWRTRYHSLALHNNTEFNHLPYMPFPVSWPTYLPKDMLADWFEAYAVAMEINFWTGTELVKADYDAAAGCWNALVRKLDGSERTLHPKHLVFANGLVGKPNKPDLPGLKDFKGEVLHTAAFSDGAKWRGKKALILGTGTSAHDVAHDLYSYGADVTLIQRGATTVVSINPSAKMIYGVYEGVPLEDGDLFAATNTFPVLRKNLQLITARMVEADKKMIEGLTARGFKWSMGDDNAGHQMLIRRRYGGYFLDGGCAQLVIDGKIGLMQWDRVESFTANGASLIDGTVKPADLIVLGTGFVMQGEVIGNILGEAVAKKVGPVWGLRPDGEMNNMWRRTPQEGLWFIGGSFANCRTYSRYVAMQIKAIEEGLLPRSADQ